MSETPLSQSAKMSLKDYLKMKNSEDLTEACESLGYISKTIHGNMKMYTVEEFFSCELEYSSILEYLQGELDNFEPKFQNPSDVAKKASHLLLTAKRKEFEQIVKNHQNLSIGRRNCAASNIFKYSEVLKSTEHHRIQLMDVNLDSTSFIDERQRSAGNPNFESSQSNEKRRDFRRALNEEDAMAHKSITALFKKLDIICLSSLNQVMEKHCNTSKFLLEIVRDARTKRLATTSPLISEIVEKWKWETIAVAYELYASETPAAYKSSTILYYIIGFVNFARMFGPGALSWVYYFFHYNRCCRAAIFLEKLLVEVEPYKSEAFSEFNVQNYTSMALCENTEHSKLSTEVLDKLLDSDVKTYNDFVAPDLSQREIAFERIQKESNKMKAVSTKFERDIIESKISSSNSWNMLVWNFDLSVEPHATIMQSQIDRLISLNKQIGCNRFSEKSLQMPEFCSHLEFVRWQNSEVPRQLLRFKVNFIHRRDAISLNLRHQYVLEYIRCRAAAVMDFCSRIVLWLYPIFSGVLQKANEIKKKTNPSEIECLRLEFSKSSAPFFSWLIIIFGGTFCLALIVSKGVMFVRTCIPWFRRYWRHEPLLPQ
ncbi:hypothetical protein PUMCH_002466 [Australozyma saopauloensis]|uniref:Uncharacterized protein n=1 Tax=Australozyma saopauloensis TaxID=291208 RepID=A0AAX4H9I4_9ASCO|nr:hypothetical protein PUMCH_002420 [[Candida] saopauloensis]WPK25163.1 hypothetical protein PUMCH_002466 [[Candida] saopauloensis]